MHNTAPDTHDTAPFTIFKSRIRFKLNIRRKTAVHMGLNSYPRLNILFVHIPKTAGTSIHATLAAVDRTARTGVYNYDLEKLLYTHPGNKHLKAYQWRRIIGKHSFRKIIKFTIVRNPWDLMVSSYEWWRQKANRFPALYQLSTCVQCMSFAEFLRSDVGSNRIAEWPGEFRDWYQYRGVDIVDTILKFEDLDEAIPTFLRNRSLSMSYELQLPHMNITLRKSYRKYYDERDVKLVGDRFEYDISRFNYSF
jgi:Sulfotransferase family